MTSTNHPKNMPSGAKCLQQTVAQLAWIGCEWRGHFVSFWHFVGLHVGSFWHPFILFRRPKSPLGVPRKGSGNQVGNKTPPALKFKQMASKWDPKSQGWWDFRFLFPICCSHYFWDGLLMVFVDAFWIEFCIFVMLYLDVFGYLFETS
jgi:hypothetical protein